VNKRPDMIEVDSSLVRKLNGEGLFSVPAWAITRLWFSSAASGHFFVDQRGTRCYLRMTQLPLDNRTRS